MLGAGLGYPAVGDPRWTPPGASSCPFFSLNHPEVANVLIWGKKKMSLGGFGWSLQRLMGSFGVRKGQSLSHRLGK